MDTHASAGGVAVHGRRLSGFVLVVSGVNPLLALSVFLVAVIVPVFYSLVLYKRLEKQGRLGNEGQAPAP